MPRELAQVKGIGDKLVERNRDNIVVGGAKSQGHALPRQPAPAERRPSHRRDRRRSRRGLAPGATLHRRTGLHRPSLGPRQFAMLNFAPPVGANMILPRYHISPSSIAGAGNGVILDEAVETGQILVAPDAIPRTWTFEEVLAQPNAQQLLPATVRWFEDRYTVSLDWPDECYVNHSFAPTGLWHLGFIFAAARLARRHRNHR